MAKIDGTNFYQMKVRYDNNTSFIMYYDENGYMYYKTRDGEFREWCHVWPSGEVEQYTKDNMNQSPYLIGDMEYAGLPPNENSDEASPYANPIETVSDTFNQVIPDGSPRASDLTFIGTVSSMDGFMFGQSTSEKGEIYMDSSGRLFAKLNGGYVALFGMTNDGKKLLTIDNFAENPDYCFIGCDGLGNTPIETTNIIGVNFDARALADALGESSVFNYLKDYDMFSALERNTYILKAKDGSGFYLYKNGKLTHISNIQPDGQYVGYDSMSLKDDAGNDLGYTIKTVFDKKFGDFFSAYNVDTLGIKNDENEEPQTPTTNTTASIKYDFSFDKDKITSVITKLRGYTSMIDDNIESIYRLIESVGKDGAWTGTVYNQFNSSCQEYRKVFDDYVDVINEYIKSLQKISDQAVTFSEKIKAAKSKVEVN